MEETDRNEHSLHRPGILRNIDGNVEEVGIEEIKDHILVRTWLNQESGREEPDHCLEKVELAERQRATEELRQGGWILKEMQNIYLTEKGEEKARTLIRRHRLAERLFAVVFNLSEEAVHAQACRMEHENVLTPDAVEGICSFLGHPPTCPHGRPIPPGECCRLFVEEVTPLVTPLSQGEIGKNYKIVFIAPKYHQLLERLSGLGISPGSQLHLSQKKPSYVLKVDETEVALDSEITSGIYVVRQTNT